MVSKAKAKKKGNSHKIFRPPVVDMGPTMSINVKSTNEEWSTYKLVDGTSLKVKPVISAVERSKSVYNPTGEPVYRIQAAIVIQTDVPNRLKKKVRKS